MRLALIISIILVGCASMEEVDRSLISTPLASFGESEGAAPHTGLRGNSSKGGSGCSVCAH